MPGLLLLIVYRKKIKLMPGKVTIPKGKRFTTIIVNLGMLLFCGIWLIEIIRQIVLPTLFTEVFFIHPP